MGKQTAASVIFISHMSVKSCAYGITTILPFDSHYAIFHLCEFLLVPKCAYLYYVFLSVVAGPSNTGTGNTEPLMKPPTSTIVPNTGKKLTCFCQT